MNNFTQGDTRVTVTDQGNGSIVLDSRLIRSLYFNGKFLSARDLERDQNYFLQRQADLGRAAGFGVVRGLWVDRKAADAETLIVRSGHGITPAGELVMIPRDLTLRLSDVAEELKLDLSFGVGATPKQPSRTRTGLFVLALRTVEFTANPITSYPTTIQGTRTTHDGDIVEATAVTLIPYPDPVSNFDAAHRRAALAQQVFVTGSKGPLADSVLPLAMISVQRGAVEWVDPYLVRRDSGPEYSGVRFGLTDPATQQAFLLQYDAQLQETIATRREANLAARFSATDYFRVLPPAGRFPLATINATDFSQVFFPQQLDVRLSVVPEDEIAALIEESMSLPPIDLTLPSQAYANLAVMALVPVPRDGFAKLKIDLGTVPVPLLHTPSQMQPLQLLQLSQIALPFAAAAAAAAAAATAKRAWTNAIGTQPFGFYLRLRSAPKFEKFSTTAPTATAPTSTSSSALSSTSSKVTATTEPAAST